MKTQKKRSSPQIEAIFPRNQVKNKKEKRSSPQFATTFGRKFVGSFSPGWLFFLWSSSAQLSMGGRLNLDGGTRPPYNLSTAYGITAIFKTLKYLSLMALLALSWMAEFFY